MIDITRKDKAGVTLRRAELLNNNVNLELYILNN